MCRICKDLSTSGSNIEDDILDWDLLYPAPLEVDPTAAASIGMNHVEVMLDGVFENIGQKKDASSSEVNYAEKCNTLETEQGDLQPSIEFSINTPKTQMVSIPFLIILRTAHKFE